ncbi:hypothetical protein JCM10207_005200 [Rhodosporidiobolus poonsookiae]
MSDSINSPAEQANAFLKEQPAYFVRDTAGGVEVRRLPGASAGAQDLHHRAALIKAAAAQSGSPAVAGLANSLKRVTRLYESSLDPMRTFIAQATNWPMALPYQDIFSSWRGALGQPARPEFLHLCDTSLMPVILLNNQTALKRADKWLEAHLAASEAVYHLCFDRIITEPLAVVSDAKQRIRLWDRFQKELEYALRPERKAWKAGEKTVAPSPAGWPRPSKPTILDVLRHSEVLWKRVLAGQTTSRVSRYAPAAAGILKVNPRSLFRRRSSRSSDSSGSGSSATVQGR